MNARFQIKTLVRLVSVLAIGSVSVTFLAGPKADAASDGYGVTVASNLDGWHSPSLIEGRTIAKMPKLDVADLD